MSLDGLYPFAGDHAIQSAVFAFEWNESLSPTALDAFRSASKKHLGEEFPNLQEQRSLSVDLGAVAGATKAKVRAANEVSGFALERPRGFGLTPGRVLSVSREQLLVVVQDYSDWKTVKSDVGRYLDVFVPLTKPNAVAISGVGLQYTDVFTWKSDLKDLKQDEIFARGGPYLAPNVFDTTNLWHSHHGYFEDYQDPCVYRQLDNINVSRLDTQGVQSFQILTSHRARFPEPMYKLGEKRSLISAIQDKLHARNKDILRKLLTTELQKKISLDKETK